MKKLIVFMMALGLMLSCSEEQITSDIVTEDATETFAKGKPLVPKKTSIVLAPTAVNTNIEGRYMATLQEYDGELPTDEITNVSWGLPEYPNYNQGTSGVVDWDQNGVDDIVSVLRVGRTWWSDYKVTVKLNGSNEEIGINYNIQGGKLLGFKDVNGDTFPDIIMEYGIPACYDGVIGDLSDTERTASQYNVGYNTFGQYPLTTLEIVSSMVVRDVPKGRINNVKWDLSEYGYNCYVFYLDLLEGTSWETRTDYFGNWPGYSEWGFYNDDSMNKNTVYTLRFRYLDNGEVYNLNFSF